MEANWRLYLVLLSYLLCFESGSDLQVFFYRLKMMFLLNGSRNAIRALIISFLVLSFFVQVVSFALFLFQDATFVILITVFDKARNCVDIPSTHLPTFINSSVGNQMCTPTPNASQYAYLDPTMPSAPVLTLLPSSQPTSSTFNAPSSAPIERINSLEPHTE